MRYNAGRAKPIEPWLRKRLGLGWTLLSFHMCHMTPTTPHSQNHQHKLQVCTMAGTTESSVLDLTWAACLNFSFLCPSKTAWPRKLNIYQFQILKYNLDSMCKIIRGPQGSNWKRTKNYLNHIRETLGRGPRLKGENQNSLKSGFQRTEQDPKVCSVTELIYLLLYFVYFQKRLETNYNKNMKIYG